MTTWELIAEKSKALPPKVQQEVLDFIEFMQTRRLSKKRGKDLAGIWKRLNVAVTEDDIEQARREMWNRFPSEDV